MKKERRMIVKTAAVLLGIPERELQQMVNKLDDRTIMQIDTYFRAMACAPEFPKITDEGRQAIIDFSAVQVKILLGFEDEEYIFAHVGKANKCPKCNAIEERGVPEHPELYYRITGDWKGWHDFLGPDSDESKDQDDIENQAFTMLKQNPEYSGQYNDATIKIWGELTR